jgi:outer membrane protein OmpA-like peptidoglycan-associated protein
MRRRSLLAAPLVALSALPARAQPQKFIVFFHPWSAELDPPARDVLAAAIAHARANPALHVDIVGFASTIGGNRANLYLSLVRAQRLSDLMAEAGIDPARIARIGEGAVNSVGTAEEARRVEIGFRAP